jgi:hypothetical protein
VELPRVNFTNILCNCANILAQIKSLTFTASTKKLRAKLSYEKGARKMLVKLTPGGWYPVSSSDTDSGSGSEIN